MSAGIGGIPSTTRLSPGVIVFCSAANAVSAVAQRRRREAGEVIFIG
jgi:hypothetical protein